MKTNVNLSKILTPEELPQINEIILIKKVFGWMWPLREFASNDGTA
jgi:hypothetical protein